MRTDEFKAIGEIAKRGGDIFKECDIMINEEAIGIYIKTCHLDACPIDLNRLKNASTVDFMHDIIGIIRNLDLLNGKLTNCFTPRFALLE